MNSATGLQGSSQHATAWQEGMLTAEVIIMCDNHAPDHMKTLCLSNPPPPKRAHSSSPLELAEPLPAALAYRRRVRVWEGTETSLKPRATILQRQVGCVDWRQGERGRVE